MIGHDLVNSLGVARALSPVTQTNADTALVSEIIDVSAYVGGMFVIATGGLTDANATFATTMDEGDDSSLSDAAAVAAADLITMTNGTAALTAASFTFASDDSIFRIGYNGIKRYVRLTITPTGNNSGAAPLAVVWVGVPRKRGNTLGS